MYNKLYGEILQQAADYFAAKQYHLITDNLKIAVEILGQDAKEAAISTENKKQLEDLLCKVLPFLDRQIQEKEWHRILRDLALQANEILKSQKLERVILSHLREEVIYPELYREHNWPEVVGGCDEILALSKKTPDLHRSLQDPETAKYPQLVNIIGNYHLLKIIF